MRTSARSGGRYGEVEVEELLSGSVEELRGRDWFAIYCHEMKQAGHLLLTEEGTPGELKSLMLLAEWLGAGGAVDPREYLHLAIRYWDVIRSEQFRFREMRTPSVQILVKRDFAREIWAILLERGLARDQKAQEKPKKKKRLISEMLIPLEDKA